MTDDRDRQRIRAADDAKVVNEKLASDGGCRPGSASDGGFKGVKPGMQVIKSFHLCSRKWSESKRHRPALGDMTYSC